MATNESVFSEMIPQKIMSGVISTRQGMDPMFSGFKRSADGVVPLSQLSFGATGYQFEKVFDLGMGGVVRFVGTTAPAVTGTIAPQWMPTEVQTYPGALESTNPGWDRLIGYLACVRGNIAVEDRVLEQANNPNAVADYFNRLMDGVALRISLHQIAKFHTPSSDTRHLFAVSSWSTTGGITGSFVPAEGNEVLVHEGSMLHFFGLNTADPNDTKIWYRHSASGSTTGALGAKIIVTGVDPLTRTVYVASVDGSNLMAITGNAVANTDIVVFQGELETPGAVAGTGVSVTGASCVEYGAYGLVDWLVNGSTLLGLPLTTFHRVKSLITANLAGPLTDIDIEKHVGWFRRWHKAWPRDFWMTDGVRRAYKETQLGMFRADRTGVDANVVGGSHAEYIVCDGEKVYLRVTPYMRSGIALGLVTDGNNFMELHPPSSGMNKGARDSRVPDVQFKVNHNGSIFRPVTWSPSGGGVGQLTSMHEAPFEMWYQHWPMKHLPGIVIKGCTEVNYA